VSERWRASALLLLVLATPLAGQADGPAHSFQDSLFDRLAGNWTMTGAIAARSGHDFLAWAERVGDGAWFRLGLGQASANLSCNACGADGQVSGSTLSIQGGGSLVLVEVNLGFMR